MSLRWVLFKLMTLPIVLLGELSTHKEEPLLSNWTNGTSWNKKNYYLQWISLNCLLQVSCVSFWYTQHHSPPWGWDIRVQWIFILTWYSCCRENAAHICHGSDPDALGWGYNFVKEVVTKRCFRREVSFRGVFAGRHDRQWSFSRREHKVVSRK